MDLILMRHPPPDIAPGLCYGRTDLPVDAARFDASVAAMQAKLAALLDDRTPVAIHSSPLRRARRAAEVLATSFGLPVTVDERLAEMDFGTWEMQPWDAIDRNDLDAWARDVGGYAPPGGESARDIVLRMDAWARALRGAASATRDVHDVHVVVAHAGPIRLHTATALRMPTTACLSWSLDFGGLCHLRLDDDGNARLLRWNA
ncbi:alpha-ribazole phosphatase [Pandoraea fibrosis]|uniref:Alpha-ribazole phosphatase n=1 Tax=Pandoraea fibrosis TaxID=1891094 RepID=A0ABX6HVN9_9BURK|nr:histidine phosphatase family protein [Pandoraea fibrosis]QHE91450.1 alpha-ribazole phosphatase [Pandoraea fibrosis]QHF14992.1 alpha-ribazole phosphatase [Pandoraea fibrosis]